MRIALVGPYPLVGPRNGGRIDVAGGVERVMHSLAHALASIEGVDVHVVSPRPEVRSYEQTWDHHVRVHYTPAVRRFGNVSLGIVEHARVRHAVARCKPDVIHCHNHLFYPYLTREAPAPTVTSIHGIIRMEERFRTGLRSAVRRRSRTVWERLALHKLETLICVSEYVRRTVSRPGQRAVTIPNPVDGAFFRLDRRSDGPSVLSVGRVEPRKNVLGLVRALAELRNQVPDVVLRIAGGLDDRAYVDEVRATAVRERVDDRIELLGQVPVDALLREYERAAVVASMSFEETSGLSLIEGMAGGVPVVGPDVGGVPEVISDGQSGFLVDPADPAGAARRLAVILTDDHLAESMGAQGRSIAHARFSAHSHTTATLVVYEQLLGQSASTPSASNIGRQVP